MTWEGLTIREAAAELSSAAEQLARAAGKDPAFNDLVAPVWDAISNLNIALQAGPA